ncbi:MAG: DUF1850 domain-containing protein [Hydrogenophaga sp.]|nr:DUF1850 domain-containing protein [Hydrogenophaga sp.]
MTPARRSAALALALALVLCGPLAANACELVFSEHRSQRELLRLPLRATEPRADVAFTHSVLGTPVLDRYVWRAGTPGWRAHLVEEQFDGEGYGLPSAPGPGERLERVLAGGRSFSRLTLDRVVDPLVVRPLPAQQMRVQVAGQAPVLLGHLSDQAIELRAKGCQKQADPTEDNTQP